MVVAAPLIRSWLQQPQPSDENNIGDPQDVAEQAADHLRVHIALRVEASSDWFRGTHLLSSNQGTA